MSDKTTIRFNGVDLTAGFVVSDLVRPFLMRTINTTQVDGRDGAIYRSSSYDAIDVKMRLSFESTDRNERVLAMANLVKALDVDEPARLEISDDGGWYYLAIPAGGQIDRYIGADSFPLTFHCPDPRRYGEEHTEKWPASPAPLIGGNVATSPKLLIKGTPASGFTTFSFYYGKANAPASERGFFQFDFSGTKFLNIDCETRKCQIASSASGPWTDIMPSVGSRFIDVGAGWRVTEGPSRIGTIDASASTITWTDRWL